MASGKLRRRPGAVRRSRVRIAATLRLRLLGRCEGATYLIQASRFMSTRPNSMGLWDINANKEYGAYSHSNRWPGRPLQCYVPASYCQTEEEWRALIRPFMEE
jgi:hypothetical protein